MFSFVPTFQPAGDPTDWATAEFRGLDLGDARLDARAVATVQTLARQASESIPVAGQTPAEIKAIYRFLTNRKVTPPALLVPTGALPATASAPIRWCWCYTISPNSIIPTRRWPRCSGGSATTARAACFSTCCWPSPLTACRWGWWIPIPGCAPPRGYRQGSAALAHRV